ncbi:MAG: hypothetical protein IJT04_02745 [Bacteroidales bacterium]|nr:hypothetical protein [Bacteroidales bacterium]
MARLADVCFSARAYFGGDMGHCICSGKTMVISVIKNGLLFFACRMHAILVTSYQRNEVERSMRWATARATSVQNARHFFCYLVNTNLPSIIVNIT